MVLKEEGFVFVFFLSELCLCVYFVVRGCCVCFTMFEGCCCVFLGLGDLFGWYLGESSLSFTV